MENLQPELQEHMGKMTRPIPGYSLTEDPTTPQPHLKAPEFTVPREAIEYTFMSLMEEQNHTRLLQALLDETTILEITQAILFKGYTEGKWNPDLLMILIEPVAHIVMAMAEKAGIDYDLDDEDGDNYDSGMMESVISNLNITKNDEEPEIVKDFVAEIESTKLPESSLLAPPEEEK
jgi:hypothetical protein